MKTTVEILRHYIKQVIKEVNVTKLPPGPTPSGGQNWIDEHDLTPEQLEKLQTTLKNYNKRRNMAGPPLSVSMCSFEPVGGGKITCNVRGHVLTWNGTKWVSGPRMDPNASDDYIVY